MKKPTKFTFPEPPPPSEDELAQAFPGGFGVRDEANALAAYAFRNGPLENLHAGRASPLTGDPNVSRITDAEMKNLMIHASEKLADMLAMREVDPEKYKRFVRRYGLIYCRAWNR